MVEIKSQKLVKSHCIFINYEKDYISIEHCFGPQGHPGSARMLIMYDSTSTYISFISKFRWVHPIKFYSNFDKINILLDYGKKIHEEFSNIIDGNLFSIPYDKCSKECQIEKKSCEKCEEKIERLNREAKEWYEANPIPDEWKIE